LLPALIGAALVVAAAITIGVLAKGNGAPQESPASTVATRTPEPTPLDAPVADAPLDEVIEMPVNSARAPKPGTISIDSTPFATIYVDGKRIDVTPILKRPLSAGRHKIRAVLTDGRAKELTIEVPAGRAAKPVVLSW
jgi:hypothetical protein